MCSCAVFILQGFMQCHCMEHSRALFFRQTSLHSCASSSMIYYGTTCRNLGDTAGYVLNFSEEDSEDRNVSSLTFKTPLSFCLSLLSNPCIISHLIKGSRYFPSVTTHSVRLYGRASPLLSFLTRWMSVLQS